MTAVHAMVRRLVLGAGACLALLAGCSSDGQIQDLNTTVARRWLSDVPATGVSPATDPRYLALAEAGAPGMAMTRAETGAQQVLLRLGRSADGDVTWLGADGAGYVFRNGVLVATRGTPNDLMGSDLGQLQVLLAPGSGGRADRFESRLDGQNHVITESFVCTIGSGGAGELLEDCAGAERSFVNAYRMGSGRVIASRQSAGPGLTYLFNWQDQP